jgi:hypothetical protein
MNHLGAEPGASPIPANLPFEPGDAATTVEANRNHPWTAGTLLSYPVFGVIPAWALLAGVVVLWLSDGGRRRRR